MSGWNGKKGSGGTLSSAPHRDGRFYRIAQIYERTRAQDGADDTIDLTWTTGRDPHPVEVPLPLPPEVRDHWRARRAPGAPVIARPGHGAASDTNAGGTLFVTLFGLTGEQLGKAVSRIERQVQPARDMRPVFLTDQPDTSIFRLGGFSYEYLPASVFGSPEQAPLFSTRFETLWRKWNAMLLIDFSASGYLAARLENLETYVDREFFAKDRYDPRRPKPAPHPPSVTDVVALRASYRASGLDEEADTFVLYRVLGNDLPPRHEIGQTLSNLRFMLDNEPELEACEKRWVVNRIVDPEQEAAVIALLEERGQHYLHIPFDLGEYGRVGWDFDGFPDEGFFLRGRYERMTSYDQGRAQAHLRRFKNNYVINNNGARNAALRDGKGCAKWVLPWDGNCFLTAQAWSEIVTAVRARPYLKYFTVPMARATDNAALLDPSYRPEPDSEPQVLFRRDSTEEFSEAHFYGRRPKVELFYRLGIRGPWDRFSDDVWDLPRPGLSDDAGATGQAGWVARLFSGQGKLETEGQSIIRARGEARIAAVTDMLDRLDVEAMKLVYRPEKLTCYDEAAVRALADAAGNTPEHRLFDRLILEADLARQRGPHSVMQKTEMAPSGDLHDYYHPAPYWWPNPATPGGYPHVFRDGERVLGTRLYEPESARFDRTRLQLLFDDTTVLALGWLATGRDGYAQHAAQLIRTWFLDPETRMNPHLSYAQVRGRWPGDTGAKSGLIEMKDLYYLLDAVRIVERSGALDEDERAAFRAWLRDYLEWLQTSEQGTEERLTRNNHGTCYDLQTASIAAFLGDAELLERTFLTSRERILEQFTAEGGQPHEMTRTQTAHYCLFNLQCWVNLATLAEACGHDLWSFEGQDGRGLARAFGWLLPHMAMESWPHQQIEPFDTSRYLPLYFCARDRSGARPFGVPSLAVEQCDPLFFPHDGIKPFWVLGLKPNMASGGGWAALAPVLATVATAAAGLVEGGRSGEPGTGPEELAARLRGGFSRSAETALRQILAADDTSHAAKSQAGWALAKWAFRRGEHAEALGFASVVEPSDMPGTRALAILRAASLVETGAVQDAETVVAEQLERYPHDPDYILLMANLMRLRSDGGDRWTEWLNRIYRNAGLDGLLGTEDGSVGWQLPKRASPDLPGVSPDDFGPGVTIVLAPPPGSAPAEATLSSALSQVWGNLEILLVDRSGDSAVAGDLAARGARDPRITVLTLPGETPEHAARNAALGQAKGDHVTRLEQGECAHPMRTALQVEALRRTTAQAVLARHVTMTPEGEALVGWADGQGGDGPALLRDNPASLMADTAILRSMGGWDALPGDPDPLLLWRLTEAGILRPDDVACPDVPLSLSISLTDNSRGLPIEAGDSRLRAARALARHRLGRSRAAMETALPDALPALAFRSEPGLDTVFIGDVSENAPGLEHILALIEGEADVSARLGLFHWPDPLTDWRSDPAARVLDMIEAGRLCWVHPGDGIKADRLVVWQRHVCGEVIDGLPEFGARQVELLGGPQLRPPAPVEPASRRPPDAAVLEALFSCPVVHRAI
jgi:hypothetical protein